MEGRRDEWLYGIIPVSVALRAQRRRVREIWIDSAGQNRRLQAVKASAEGISVYEVSRRELDQRSHGGRHQGVVARLEPFPWSPLEALTEGEGPLLMLEGIQDPQNLGAILRSSVALGVKGVIMERRRTAPLSPVTAKAACGALEYARLCRVPNLPRAIRAVKRADHWVVGTRVEGGALLWGADLPKRLAVVVGGEGFGLRPVVEKACDLWVSIPSVGPIRTLNSSVAAAVVLYEILRRRSEGTRMAEERD